MIHWADIEDAEDRFYTAGEIEEMVTKYTPIQKVIGDPEKMTSSGLPHQKGPSSVGVVLEAFPELEESEDQLTALGFHIGQSLGGRGGLPSRLKRAPHAEPRGAAPATALLPGRGEDYQR